MGDLVLLKARWSGLLFVYCSSCGLAFDAPPDGIEAFQTPDDFAPEGFVLPDADEVRRAVREGWSPNDEGPVDEWWSESLREELHRG